MIERIAPDHRDKVRQALANAAMYGAFDVSFRVPDRGGRASRSFPGHSPPASIDE